MHTILNISEATSLALHAAALLAKEPERRRSNTDLAASLGASEAHLAKVLARLTRAGLVLSSRGRRGGVLLAQEPSRISLREVYEAMEGRPSHSRCLLRGQERQCGADCILGDLVASVQRQVLDYLGSTTLADLPGASLEGLPGPVGRRA